MTRRFFHVYADRKTVREITEQEYNRLSQQLGYKCVWLDGADVVLVHGKNVVIVAIAQLKQILGGSQT